jgi:hypothetical protein
MHHCAPHEDSQTTTIASLSCQPDTELLRHHCATIAALQLDHGCIPYLWPNSKMSSISRHRRATML